jgi:hypothetical protein
MTSFPDVTCNIVEQFAAIALVIRRRRAAKIHTPPDA